MTSTVAPCLERRANLELRLVGAVFLLGLAAALAGCGGSGSGAGAGASTNASSSSSSSSAQGLHAPQLQSIALAPPDASVAAGFTHQFTATGIYADNSRQDISSTVTWSSADAGVASISNTAGTAGLAAAVSPGSTTITASLGGISGTTTLTVTAATLVSVGVTPASSSVAAGLTHQLTATGVYSDNSTHDLTASVAWSSADTTVAAVSNSAGANGLVTAVSPGSTTITATMGGISGTTTMTVTGATLVSVGVTPASPMMAKGLTRQFTATGVYSDNSTHDLTASVAWSSSDTTIATIGNTTGASGLVSAVAPGTTTIQATVGGLSGTTILSVTAAALVSIGMTPTSPSIANGTSQQLTATGTYTDNSTQNLTTSVTWSSSDTTIAAVSNATGFNGLTTTLKQGVVTVTAALGGVSGSTTLTVTPATLESIAVTPTSSSIANGTSHTFIATGTYTDNSTQNLTASVAWSSSDATIATVSNAAGSSGLATTLKQGSVTITAALGSVSGSTILTVTPGALVSIAVTPTSSSIANGTSQQFTATGTYTDNSTQNLTTSVTWSSSDATIAAVSNAAGSAGLATTLKQGSVTVAAALGSVSGSTTLTVTPATLVSIAVTPTNPSIANGTSQQFTATGTYTDGSTQNLTTSVTWSSSDTTIATVSNAASSHGLATTLKGGLLTIKAALGSASGSTALTVTQSTGTPPSAWSAVIPLAVNPISVANLPNGKLLMWSAYEQFVFEGDIGQASGQTYTALFDPSTGASTEQLVTATGADMFCPGIAVLPDGRVLANGGSSSPKTSIYSAASNAWSVAAEMNVPRGYQGDTLLSNGAVLTLGGSWSGGLGGKTGEIWTAAGGWKLATGIPETNVIGPDPQGIYRGDNHLWLFAASNASVFHAGPSAQMNWITTSGAGSIQSAGNRGADPYSINGNAVLFDVGKILKVGGAQAYAQPSSGTVYATNSAYLIDITAGPGAAVHVTQLPSMNYRRAFSNSVVLPNGQVVVVGGQSIPQPFTDTAAVLVPEIWDPATSTFTKLSPMQTPRTYHSTAILLPDGRVFVGGGGQCGDPCAENHLNAEIFTPPYLLNSNGTPATRPVIVSAPQQVLLGGTLAVTTQDPVTGFVLMRLSAVTHTVSNDQRRIPLRIASTSGSSYTLSVPSDPGVALPGYYMLFAMNSAGTPSVASTVQIH